MYEIENINQRKIRSTRKGKITMEDARRELEIMPFDHEFNGELCHATGEEVHFSGDPDYLWWNEYEDAAGNFHYGN